MLVMMERSLLQSNYSEKVVQEFSITICNNILVVVAKTLAGSGNRNGGKAVKVQAVSQAFSSRKTSNSDAGEERLSAGKFLYQ